MLRNQLFQTQLSALLTAVNAMSASESDCDEHDCELGKLSHWEETYRQEVQNLAATGDEGEIWCAALQTRTFSPHIKA